MDRLSTSINSTAVDLVEEALFLKQLKMTGQQY